MVLGECTRKVGPPLASLLSVSLSPSHFHFLSLCAALSLALALSFSPSPWCPPTPSSSSVSQAFSVGLVPVHFYILAERRRAHFQPQLQRVREPPCTDAQMALTNMVHQSNQIPALSSAPPTPTHGAPAQCSGFPINKSNTVINVYWCQTFLLVPGRNSGSESPWSLPEMECEVYKPTPPTLLALAPTNALSWTMG